MERRYSPRDADALCAAAEPLLGRAVTLLGDHESARADVRAGLDALRDELCRTDLATIPVARIRDVTEGRLRIGALEDAGYTTVLAVRDATPYTLQLLPGIGAQTAAQMHAAALQIARAAAAAVSVRIDVDRRDPISTALVIALHRPVNAGPDLARAVDAARDLYDTLGPLLARARPARRRWRMWLAGSGKRRDAHEALSRLAGVVERSAETDLLLTQVTTDLLRPSVSELEAWVDFEHRSAEYYGLLAELAGEPLTQGRGALPDDLVAKVGAQELDDTHRRVSLRGYQSFGARFALAQRRVILGDQMGLGKSIEAIAALAHLRARGGSHFLVICPASVLINWTREIESRSTLRAYPLHGPERGLAQREWARHGGVAIATLSGLHQLTVPAEVPVGMVVVDEAHLVKNPEARRSKAVAAWCARVERVLFLTGTPMENRVEEFRRLVEHLRPDLAATLRTSDIVAGAKAFRKAVAPAYLRRNQEDVLAELPERVESRDWVEFSGADLVAYRDAVRRRNFMAMRRAAYAHPETSAKLKRLRELVDDAREDGLKVLVFSYFRDVLATVAAALDPAHVHGPLSGSVSPARRQELVDRFSAVDGHAVLLSQIEAGGTGLNIQAASVVVFCEPQLKPSLEDQAAARAHRMGQVRTVQVHRLLAVDSLDQRLLELLGRKAALFERYAHRSDLAESAPEAIDVSEHALAQRIIEEEQKRLGAEAPASGGAVSDGAISGGAVSGGAGQVGLDGGGGAGQGPDQ
ncbi:DEAD/DEAH box helicase [Spongiactinospora sp. TRM90649]|uniref:DEAD/DEAH box helicase n=1 Tax=Spongiactinospora sp. TRM90649 TaxID=3031114 RepID=UPI0023F7D1BA|nr:DEAD/DEAH box helicase [Spongiactinospora sp. TRM90649]MDF5753143.1 DEAD/DEAH box helicase [Spongiactinospora sp. TRM90649]